MKNKKHKLYPTWNNIKQRCYNKNNPSYIHYGGRGIKVCDRWLHSFENFIQDVGEKPNSEYSLDRINNNGDYEPTNIRWATLSQQQLNKRPRTEEHIRNIAKTKIGNKYWTGKSHNDDSKIKMSMTKMKNNHGEIAKDIFSLLDNGTSVNRITKLFHICKRTVKKMNQNRELCLRP